MKLTAEQQQAIDRVDCDLIVTAGAGSGKTKTMVDRAISLITSGVDVERITMLTYTEAAAAEMKERFRVELSKRLKGETDKDVRERILNQIDAIPYAQISTIHSFCFSLVREFFEQVPIAPSVRIVDDEGQKPLKAKAFQKTLLIMQEDERFEQMRAQVALRRDDDLWTLIELLYEKMLVQPDRQKWLSNVIKSNFTKDVEETPACRYLVDKIVRYAKYVCETSRDLLAKLNQSGVEDKNGKKGLSTLVANYQMFESCASLGECLQAYQEHLSVKATVNKKDSPYEDRIALLVKFGKEQITERMQAIAECGTIDEIRARHLSIQSHVGSLIDSVLLFDEQYAAIKKENGVVDFADLEKFTIDLLKDDSLREEIVSRRDYVFVDEFQDVNEVQNTIVHLITPPDRLFTVGDSKQSIYRFRQADPNIFLSRLDELTPKGEAISFLDNFRSDKPILEFVNRLMSPLMTRSFGGVDYQDQAAFRIRPEAADGENRVRVALLSPVVKEKRSVEGIYRVKDDVGVVEETTGDEEGKVIVAYIQELLGKPVTIKGVTRPLTYADFAILFRSRGGSAGAIIKQLTMAGIPLNGESFDNDSGQREIALLFNYARLLDNHRQDYPLLTVMHSAFGGFSDDELAEIRLAASPFAPFWKACEQYARQENELGARLKAFLEINQRYRFASSFTPLSKLFTSLVYQTGFADRVLTLEDGLSRLSVLLNYIGGLDSLYVSSDLSTFAEYARVTEVDKLDLKRSASGVGVSVMTIHHSKGLEFPVVVVADVGHQTKDSSDAVVADRDLGIGTKYYDPTTRTSYNTIAMLGIKQKIKDETREDALRLLYVATTRAQNYLLITGKAAKACAIPELGNTFAQWVQYAIDKEGLHSYLWRPDPTQASEDSPATEIPLEVKEEQDWEKVLSYVYPHSSAVGLSPKYTVTALNALSAEGEPTSPALFGDEDAPKRGTDYHKVLEHIDLSADSPEQVEAQLAELVEEGVLTKEEASVVDRQALSRVLSLPLMRSIAKGTSFREQRFVMPAVASDLGLDCDESVLVQGTVDLIAEVDGKLLVVDYKHSVKSADKLKETYRTQLELYARAVSSAYSRPVDAKYLVELSRGLVIEV